MKCQNLFSKKNKKTISKFCLLEFLPRELGIKGHVQCIVWKVLPLFFFFFFKARQLKGKISCTKEVNSFL